MIRDLHSSDSQLLKMFNLQSRFRIDRTEIWAKPLISTSENESPESYVCPRT